MSPSIHLPHATHHLPGQRHLLAAVEDATLAASIHNSQPWRFVLSPGRVEVWLDLTERPHIIDPDGRWVLQSLGAALANLELGVRCRAERPVTVVLSAGVRTGAKVTGARGLMDLAARPVAVLSVGEEPSPPDAEETALHDAVPTRRTSRWPSVEPVGEALVHAVVATAAGAPGSPAVEILVLDDAQARGLLELTSDAEHGWRADVAYLAEVEQWVDRDDGRGVPAGSLGPRDSSGRFAGRDFAVGVSGARPAPPSERFEERPELVAVRTAGDGYLDWLRAGIALQRLMLAATAAGADVGVLGQLVEHESGRSLAGALLGDRERGTVQQLVRLGHSDPRHHHPPPTPRRPVADVVTWQV